jgi:hypothetical protein
MHLQERPPNPHHPSPLAMQRMGAGRYHEWLARALEYRSTQVRRSIHCAEARVATKATRVRRAPVHRARAPNTWRSCWNAPCGPAARGQQPGAGRAPARAR